MLHKYSVIIFIVILLSTACSGDSRLSTAKIEEVDNDVSVQIPDFQEFNVGGVSIWLPDTCEGGTFDDYVDAKVARGSNREELTSNSGLLHSGFEIVLMVFNPGTKGFLHDIYKTPLPSLDFVSDLPEPIGEVLSSEFLVINENNAFKKIVGYETPDGTAVRRHFYAIEDKNEKIWFVCFFTEATNYDELLPIFEKSIQTIRFDL